ncbi:MAG: imidazole glycerol phosphate synthase subunit HisH [Lentisphaeria bacterium]|nr:imidazole glycerol phosphate synthase subunit HisH [Lentisphaeria bacterium]
MITIIDYKAGNLTSVRLAFQAVDIEVKVSNDPAEILAAEKVVFPGVGAVGTAMSELQKGELGDAIRQSVAKKTPFLGICLGTQILLEYSEEDGGVETLGLIPGQVKRFQPKSKWDKVPEIGWNQVEFKIEHPVLSGIENGAEFYFVHSYYPATKYDENCYATTEYADATFSSIVGKENLIATQFHPERSGRIGLQLLKNFSNWSGQC